MTEEKIDKFVQQVGNYLLEHNVEKSIVDNIQKMINGFCNSETKGFSNSLIDYCEKKWYEYYGDDIVEDFVHRPISTKLKTRIIDFKNNNNLELKDYKNFSDWLLENSYNNSKRRMFVADLYSERLYKRYKENNFEEEKPIIKKRKFNKNIFRL